MVKKIRKFGAKILNLKVKKKEKKLPKNGTKEITKKLGLYPNEPGFSIIRREIKRQHLEIYSSEGELLKTKRTVICCYSIRLCEKKTNRSKCGIHVKFMDDNFCLFDGK